MTNQDFPDWKIWLYRGARAAVGAGIAQALLIPMDFSNLEAWVRLAGVSFAAGFINAFGKFLRDWLDAKYDVDEKSIVAKTMPI